MSNSFILFTEFEVRAQKGIRLMVGISPNVSANARRATLAFIRLLDIEYQALFSCPICTTQGPKDLTLIADAKAMGLNRTLAKPYVLPSAIPVVNLVPIEW